MLTKTNSNTPAVPPERFATREAAFEWLRNPIKDKATLDKWIAACHATNMYRCHPNYVGQTEPELRFYTETMTEADGKWCTRYPRLQLPSLNQDEMSRSNFHPHNWWAFRDFLRAAHGVWELAFTDILPSVPYMLSAMPHISLDDPNMIAYTPDRTAGEQDKQIKTTPEKFLRKYLPLATEKWVASLAREWVASRSTDIHLTPAILADGSKNTDAFINACRFGTANAQSCMRYSADRFENNTGPNGKKIHPLTSYVAPGFAVATLRDDMTAPQDGADDVIARAIVWQNPADEADKRWVRVYPADNSAVARRLERSLNHQGYKKIGFAGAKLASIVLHNHNTAQPRLRVLVPYLDGVDGPGDYSRGRWLRLDNGVPTIMDQDEAEGYARECSLASGMSMESFQVHGATTYCRLDLYETPVKEWTCERTGVTYQSRQKRPVAVFSGGQLYRRASADAGMVSAQMVDEHRMTLLVWTDSPVFAFGGTRYLDRDAEHEYLGHARPDPEFYPDLANTWIIESIHEAGDNKPWVRVAVEGQYRIVKGEDVAVHVYKEGDSDADWTYTLKHKSMVPATAKPAHRTRAHLAVLVDKGAPTVTTSSGRKLVRCYHNVAQTLNGEWEQAHQVATVHMPCFDITGMVREDSYDALFWKTIDFAAPEGIVSRLRRKAGTVARNYEHHSPAAVQRLGRLVTGRVDVYGSLSSAYDQRADSAAWWTSCLSRAEAIAKGESFIQEESRNDANKAMEAFWAKGVLSIQEAYLKAIKDETDAIEAALKEAQQPTQDTAAPAANIESNTLNELMAA